MSSVQSKTMTVLYLANTGHVLAAFTRTDTSGAAPSITDLAGDGLVVRGVVNDPNALPWVVPAGVFLISADSLSSNDFGIDTTNRALLRAPRTWGLSAVPSVASKTSPTISPTLKPLTFFGLSATYDKLSGKITITYPEQSSNMNYYAVIARTITDPDDTPVAMVPSQGVLLPASTSIVLQVPLPVNPPYSLLFFVEAMLPFVQDSLR